MKQLMLLGVLLSAASLSLATPCDQDVHKYCGDQQPGAGSIGDCLQAHMESHTNEQLSYQCRDWMKKMDQALKQLGTACGTSARNYCRDIRPGYQRVLNCLKAHYDKLPSECTTAIEKIGQ